MPLLKKFKNLPANLRLAVIVMGIVVLWMFTGIFSPAPSLPETQSKQVAVKVRAVASDAQEFTRYIDIIGTTKADTAANIAAEVDGTITKIYVTNGDTVKKGQALLTIDLRTRKEKMQEAKAKLDEALALQKAAVSLNKKGFKSSTALATEEAKLAEARASYAEAREAYEKSTLRSSISGIVQDITIDEGDYVAPQQALVRVMGTNRFLIVGYISQQKRDLVAVGQKATAKLINGKEVTGVIQFLASEADEKTKTFPVEMLVDEGQFVPSGMTATLKVPTPTEQAHYIPHSSLVLNNDGHMGVMIAEGNKAKFVEIDYITDDREGIWVRGLGEKVHLITLGQSYVVDGGMIRTDIVQEDEEKMNKQSEENKE